MENVTLLKLILLLAALLHNYKGNPTYTIGDPKACIMGNMSHPKLIFEVLPGFGWDNLVNKNKGRIVYFNYSQCKTTGDGQYLIPDGVVTIPVKKSKMKLFSQIYDHSDKYQSDTSSAINAQAGGMFDEVSISASFSTEHQDVKSNQINNKAKTTKVEARYVRYEASILPSIQLDPFFRLRLLRIANHLVNNMRKSARYESETLVRDFGTHVIQSIEAGAAVIKVDHVSSTLFNNNELSKRNICLSAGISLFGLFGAKVTDKLSVSKENKEKYLNSVSNTDIRTHGGLIFDPDNFTIAKWVSDIKNNLVAVDRDGLTLDTIISPTTFPELSSNLQIGLAKRIQTAIRTYYQHNTYRGCTDPDAPNFSFIANLDDGSCKVAHSHWLFGGFYQKCTFTGKSDNLCDEFTTLNPVTNDYSCPNQFTSHRVYYGEYTTSKTVTECHTNFIFFKHCEENTQFYTATFTSFWCVANSSVSQNNISRFGGLYSDYTDNIFTQSQSCPPQFVPIKIALNFIICMIVDSNNSAASALPFGGFYSCQYGNPLVSATEKPKACPKGYNKYLAVNYDQGEDECEIYYCVHISDLHHVQFPKLRAPPFVKVPIENTTENVNYIVSHDSKSWSRLASTKSEDVFEVGEEWASTGSTSYAIDHLAEVLNQNYIKKISPSNLSNDGSGSRLFCLVTVYNMGLILFLTILIRLVIKVL